MEPTFRMLKRNLQGELQKFFMILIPDGYLSRPNRKFQDIDNSKSKFRGKRDYYAYIAKCINQNKEAYMPQTGARPVRHIRSFSSYQQGHLRDTLRVLIL